jgi:serine/threonine protein phosphatase PrpC
MKIAYAACTDVGLVRSANEDYFRVLPELGLYILADGMGGARGGGIASKLAADTVAEEMGNLPRRDASTLMAAVETAHERVRQAAADQPALNGMGTTLVVALVDGQDVAIVSVGDSRAYRFSQQGLSQLTEDQTWVREVGIPLGLTEAVLRTHPMRHRLTMAIGIDAALESRYYGTSLEPGVGVVLCSDGLHGLISDQQLGLIVRDFAFPLEERCARLIAAARAAGGNDNITAVLFEAT